MRSIVFLLLTLLMAMSVSGQELSYDIRASYEKPIAKEVLHQATTLSDINPGYPSSWISESDYVSTEILVTADGVEKKSVGTNHHLSPEQQSALKKSALGTHVDVVVKYRSNGDAEADIKTMRFSATVIPDVEAEYSGGEAQIKNFLKEYVIDKISEDRARQIEFAEVRFMVDEHGKSMNARLTETSNDEGIDALLISVIADMPLWKPAENMNGIKVKQEFVLSIGNAIGC